MVPLSALVTVEETAGPSQLRRFDRLRSITITANLAPGYSLGEALDYMDRTIRTEVPEGVQINYDGESREFKQSGGRLGDVRVRAADRLPGAGGAVRELRASAGDPRHRAARRSPVRLIGLWLFGSSINVFSQIGGDHADRHRLQERHPDRRVRQPAARSRHRIRRGRDRIRGDPPAAGADDEPVHGVRRGSADDGLGRRRREPPVDRRGGVLRHRVLAGADAVRGPGPVCADGAQHALAALRQRPDRPPARGAPGQPTGDAATASRPGAGRQRSPAGIGPPRGCSRSRGA